MTAGSTGPGIASGRPHWLRLALGILILALALAACGGGTAAPAGRAVGPPAEDPAAEDPDGRAADDPAQPGGEEPPLANLVERQIVKTGEITIEVETVATAVGALRAMTLELGGYVGGSRAGDSDEPATLTLRIPADRFDEALTRIHEMPGEVMAEATREEDVTSSVVDLEARIRNLQASETQYRALLERATEIEDILTVQSRLDEVRGRIEQLQAQLDQLRGLAALATLTATVVPAAAPVEETAEAWDAGAIVDSALAALVGLGQVVATVAIWLGIVGLPVALVGGVLLLVVMRAGPGLRRRPVTPSETQIE